MKRGKLNERGALIKRLREVLSITQKELANLIPGIARNEICDMENGKRPIGELNARRLAEFFISRGFDVAWEQFYHSTNI